MSENVTEILTQRLVKVGDLQLNRFLDQFWSPRLRFFIASWSESIGFILETSQQTGPLTLRNSLVGG